MSQCGDARLKQRERLVRLPMVPAVCVLGVLRCLRSSGHGIHERLQTFCFRCSSMVEYIPQYRVQFPAPSLKFTHHAQQFLRQT